MSLKHQNQVDTEAATVRLSPDELQDLMTDAIQRHGQAQRQADHAADYHLSTVEDALDIARQLNIPEEHVRAAVEARQRSKLRGQRREMARNGRRAAFFAGIALAVLLTLGSVLFKFLFFPVGALVWILTAFLGYRWLGAPISDTEADKTDVAPVAGTCRVCGAPAYNERATFCEQHRYKGPS
jgi:hypothetical protein